MIIIYVSLLLAIVSLILFYIQKYSQMVYIQSSIDKQFYMVRKREGNTDAEVQAANLLSNVNTRMKLLIKYMTKKYPKHKGINRIKTYYNSRSLHEVPINSKNIAYSINKGKEIHLCLTKTKNGPLVTDVNDIMMLMIHEIAHIATETIGHTPEFWKNYTLIEKLAIKAKVFKKEKKTFLCGKTIKN